MPSQSTFADLPGSALLTVLKHCDEPTRVNAAQVSKDFAAIVPMARRADYLPLFKRPNRLTKEALPTATELADRGCVRPDWVKIRKTFDAASRDKPKMGKLRAFYKKAGALQKARKEGVVWRTDLGRGGSYIGGGTGRTADGFAVCTWRGGDRYEGEWKDGGMEGQGIYTWASGDCYDGEWKDSAMQGQGVYTWPVGDRYEGGWKQGWRHGQGICTWADGRRYEGAWHRARRNGWGVCTWADGRRYEGEWKHGWPDGQGVCTWTNSRRYGGAWKKGWRQGWGICDWADGRHHEGAWKHGRRDGQGVCTWADGRRYAGVWQDDKPFPCSRRSRPEEASETLQKKPSNNSNSRANNRPILGHRMFAACD